ncbi:MAG: hypothetical protein ACI9R3_004130, partial [Verrucomicrobiales bacterium]
LSAEKLDAGINRSLASLQIVHNPTKIKLILTDECMEYQNMYRSTRE